MLCAATSRETLANRGDELAALVLRGHRHSLEVLASELDVSEEACGILVKVQESRRSPIEDAGLSLAERINATKMSKQRFKLSQRFSRGVLHRA